jgi:hypothetical protein
MTDEYYSVAESTWIGNSDTIGELARILLPTHWKFERVQITGGWPIALESQHNIMMKGGILEEGTYRTSANWTFT